MIKVIFTIPWARSCQYQYVCKLLSIYSKRFTSYRHFSRTVQGQNLHKQAGDKHFFRIWRSAKPRPMINVISQSCWLDVVNINVYAKVYQNIPNGFRVIDIFRELSGDEIFTNRPVTKSSQTGR